MIKQFLENNNIKNVRFDKYHDNLIYVNDIECIFNLKDNDYYREFDNLTYIQINEDKESNLYYVMLGLIDTNDYTEYYINQSSYIKLIELIEKLYKKES